MISRKSLRSLAPFLFLLSVWQPLCCAQETAASTESDNSSQPSPLVVKLTDMVVKSKSMADEGKFEEALAKLKEAQSLAPKNPMVLNTVGFVLEMRITKDQDAAEAVYKQALEADPQNYSVQRNLGMLMYERWKLKEARKYLTLAYNNPLMLQEHGSELLKLITIIDELVDKPKPKSSTADVKRNEGH